MGNLRGVTFFFRKMATLSTVSERGARLLETASEWVDAKAALTPNELLLLYRTRLSSYEMTQLELLVQSYRALPTQLAFFHGYLYEIVGETLFREFVRVANSLSDPSRPSRSTLARRQ